MSDDTATELEKFASEYEKSEPASLRAVGTIEPLMILTERIGATCFPDKPDRNEQIGGTIENYRYLLHSYGIDIRYDIIRKDYIVSIPSVALPNDDKENIFLSHVRSVATRCRLSVNGMESTINAIASENRVNPVKDWITSKPWDWVDRIPALSATLHTDDIERRDVYVYRWLLSAVAAACSDKPVMTKGVLTLQGPESIGKTTWIKALCPLTGMVADGVSLDTDNKDSILHCIKHWIVELGELESTFKKDIQKLKAFLTMSTDSIRKPYAKAETTFQRQTVFAASVNSDEFLRDDSDNLRYWIIPVTSIDTEHGVDMQQLWAQVYELWKQGRTHWLTRDEEVMCRESNLAFKVANPLLALLHKHYDLNTQPSSWRWISPTLVLQELGVHGYADRAKATECGKALADLMKCFPRDYETRRRTNSGSVYWLPEPKAPLISLQDRGRQRPPSRPDV